MELKPCPFCGSAELFIEHNSWGCEIYCNACEASVFSSVQEKEEVVDKWNKRVDI